MSAWLFDDEAIHRLVTAVRVDRHFFDHDRNLLGASLIMMNEAAVNARYGEAHKRNEPYIWQNPAPFSPMQAYKTIRCYLSPVQRGQRANRPPWRRRLGA
jgi:hypothetical protein